LAKLRATPDWGAFAPKEADMTDAEKLAVLEQRMVELYQELILLEQTSRVYLEMFEEKQDELDELQSKFIKERNALRAETHKQEGRKHFYKQQAKMETLQKLDGYLMALSEIGND
jgi:phosphomevalonate kinase